MAQWRKANPDKAQAACMRWAARHPEEKKARDQARYERIKGSDKQKAREHTSYLRAKARNYPLILARNRASGATQRAALSDCYVRRLIVQKSGIPPEILPEPLVQLHRANVQLKREIRKTK